MVELVSLALIAVGAVILLFGATLSIYGVGLMGVVLGGGGGYLVAPTIGSAAGVDGALAVVVAVGAGAVAGLVVTYMLLSMAIAAVGFAVGMYVGFVAIAPMVDEGTLVTIGVGLAVGIAAGFLGMFLKRTTMIFATSIIGAALVSQSITASNLETAAAEFTLDPILFDLGSPVFLGLLVLGVLTQFGLFKLGYVTKLAALLPGASVLSDNKGKTSG